MTSVEYTEDGQAYLVTDQPGRRLLTEINGHPVTVPGHVGPNIGLRYLRDVRRHGVEYAVANAMEHLIGPDTLDVLADDDHLTAEQMRSLMALIEELVTGAVEMGKGNSGPRS